MSTRSEREKERERRGINRRIEKKEEKEREKREKRLEERRTPIGKGRDDTERENYVTAAEYLG